MAKKMKRFDRGGATDVEDDVKTGNFGKDAREKDKEARKLEKRDELESRMAARDARIANRDLEGRGMGDRGMGDRGMGDRGMGRDFSDRRGVNMMPDRMGKEMINTRPDPLPAPRVTPAVMGTTPVMPTAPITPAPATSPLAASAPLTPPTGSAAPSGVRPPTPLAPKTPGGPFVAMKKGGKVKAKSKCMSSGGKVSGASKRADGCAVRGKTRGRNI